MSQSDTHQTQAVARDKLRTALAQRSKEAARVAVGLEELAAADPLCKEALPWRTEAQQYRALAVDLTILSVFPDDRLAASLKSLTEHHAELNLPE